ncbi:conserved hypothetical protein [Gammaproteobacteria bacterium]
MTPKEKAEELVDKFSDAINYCSQQEVKQCALIAVDEIIKFSIPLKCTVNEDVYWQEVKQEIEKL